MNCYSSKTAECVRHFTPGSHDNFVESYEKPKSKQPSPERAYFQYRVVSAPVTWLALLGLSRPLSRLKIVDDFLSFLRYFRQMFE
jgi:hypothetical protein